MRVHLYTLTDAGIPYDKANRLLGMVRRYIQPSYIQLHRNIVLKKKATITTVTMSAWNIKALDDLCESRILNPKRSILANWLELKRIIEAIKIREGLK